MGRKLLLSFLLGQALWADDLLIEGLKTLNAPAVFLMCGKDRFVTLVKVESGVLSVCPSASNVLGYILLRVSSGLLKKYYGPVSPNELLRTAQAQSKIPKKVLVINFLGESERSLRLYKNLKDAKIITPKNETDLNSELEKLSSESFDQVVVNTHGSAVFMNGGEETLVNLDQIKKFNLLKSDGVIVHLGCNALDPISVNRSLSLTTKLSEHPVPVIGSEATVKGIGMIARYLYVLGELGVRPYGNLLESAFHQASENGAKRVVKKTNCLNSLK